MRRRQVPRKAIQIAEQVKNYLSARYGQAVERVLLYGSCARGEARESSDIDLLVVVRESLLPSQVRKELSDLLLDILLEEGELVSVLVVPDSHFKEAASPFLRHVKGEALTI